MLPIDDLEVLYTIYIFYVDNYIAVRLVIDCNVHCKII